MLALKETHVHIPFDLLLSVCRYLEEKSALGTLAAIQQASTESYRIVTPLLYRHLSITHLSAPVFLEDPNTFLVEPVGDNSRDVSAAPLCKTIEPHLSPLSCRQERIRFCLSFVECLSIRHLPCHDETKSQAFEAIGRRLKHKHLNGEGEVASLLPGLKSLILHPDVHQEISQQPSHLKSGLGYHSFFQGLQISFKVERLYIKYPAQETENLGGMKSNRNENEGIRIAVGLQSLIKGFQRVNPDLEVVIDGLCDTPIPSVADIKMTVIFAGQPGETRMIEKTPLAIQAREMKIKERLAQIGQALDATRSHAWKRDQARGVVNLVNVVGGIETRDDESIEVLEIELWRRIGTLRQREGVVFHCFSLRDVGDSRN